MPEEISGLADEYLKSGAPLASIRAQGRTGRRAWVKYSSTIPVIRAEFNYTLESGVWEPGAGKLCQQTSIMPGRRSMSHCPRASRSTISISSSNAG